MSNPTLPARASLEYLRKLEFHARVGSPAAYGLD